MVFGTPAQEFGIFTGLLRFIFLDPEAVFPRVRSPWWTNLPPPALCSTAWRPPERAQLPVRWCGIPRGRRSGRTAGGALTPSGWSPASRAWVRSLCYSSLRQRGPCCSVLHNRYVSVVGLCMPGLMRQGRLQWGIYQVDSQVVSFLRFFANKHSFFANKHSFFAMPQVSQDACQKWESFGTWKPPRNLNVGGPWKKAKRFSMWLEKWYKKLLSAKAFLSCLDCCDFFLLHVLC